MTDAERKGKWYSQFDTVKILTLFVVFSASGRPGSLGAAPRRLDKDGPLDPLPPLRGRGDDQRRHGELQLPAGDHRALQLLVVRPLRRLPRDAQAHLPG